MTLTFRQSKSYDQQLESAVQGSSGYGLAPLAYTAARIIGPDDIGRLITLSSGSGLACTLPKDSDEPRIPIGATGRVMQLGAGLVTMTAGSGATVRASGLTLKALQQYSVMTWEKIAANTYVVYGNVAAS